MRARLSKIDVLKSLPIPHRTHLFDLYRARLPETTRVQPRMEALAALLSDRQISQYVDLYLHKGGLLSWFHFRVSEKTTRSVFAALRRSHPGIDTNLLHPELEWEAPPVLYSMRRRGISTLVLQLAALDSERQYVSNWEPGVIREDSHYVIVLRDGSFTIEVRSSANKVQPLYHVVSAAIGLELRDGILCDLSDQHKREQLKAALDARCFLAQHRHDNQEVVKSSVEAHPDHDLESGSRLTDIEAEVGVTGYSRSYDFQLQHQDGYTENCEYKVKLTNGQVRVEKEMSEPAVQMLAEHVVALF